MDGTELKKSLGFWTVLALSISSIMGTGVFFGTAIGAGLAGNLILVSWIIFSIIAIYVAACFGELTSMFPKSGGVYEFSKQAYGRFLSFITGWVAWLVGNIGTVVLIVAAVEFLLPSPELRLVKIVLSIVFIVLLNFIALIGVEASGYILVLFAIIIISVLATIITRGFFFIEPQNFTPLLTHSPWLIIPAVFFLAESFFGWEAASYLSEETRNPEKTVPKAIVLGTVIVAAMGILMAVINLGVMRWDALAGSAAPMDELMKILFGEIGGQLLRMGIHLALIGAAAAGIITMPRLLLALARDRLFIGQFKAIHPRFNTPHRAIIFQTVILIVILLMGFGKYQVLLSLLVPMGFVMYIIVLLALSLMRFTKPGLKRPFKAPFGKVGPLIVSALFIASIIGWARLEPNSLNLLNLSGSLILIGIPLYFLVEIYYDPKAITNTTDLLSRYHLFTERITLPKSVIGQVLVFIGDVRGKQVLEYGAGVGTLTLPLARAVGAKGTVYATHFSANDLKIVQRRVKKQEWESLGREFGDVEIIYDPEQLTRIPPRITYADAVVSIGMLGYVQEISRVLSQVNAILPQDGKICFVEYGNFFHILPDVEWMSNDKKIEALFRAHGFSVRVYRKKGLLWNYIFIYGIKSEKDVAFV